MAAMQWAGAAASAVVRAVVVSAVDPQAVVSEVAAEVSVEEAQEAIAAATVVGTVVVTAAGMVAAMAATAVATDMAADGVMADGVMADGAASDSDLDSDIPTTEAITPIRMLMVTHTTGGITIQSPIPMRITGTLTAIRLRSRNTLLNSSIRNSSISTDRPRNNSSNMDLPPINGKAILRGRTAIRRAHLSRTCLSRTRLPKLRHRSRLHRPATTSRMLSGDTLATLVFSSTKGAVRTFNGTRNNSAQHSVFARTT